ncbi:MAG: hypothetical protein JO353_11370 [Phycisphaerae bacterium]|nr:hypothetical protein [Phycisphaerae bacterium]
MPTARKVIVDCVGVPAVAAGVVIATRWGRDSLAHVIALPIFVLLWRMFVLSAHRPTVSRDDRRAFNSVANWHALGIVACLFLMVFEGGVAGMAGSRVANASLWLWFVMFTYGPFVLFSLLAEWCIAPVRRSPLGGRKGVTSRGTKGGHLPICPSF